jgi:hypothetical protein
MNKSNDKFDKSKGKSSWRHHFIPEFLLKGFTNSSDKLYIYDKAKDLILKSGKPPRSYFFEPDRNTIDISESLRSSILEDILYQHIDDQGSKVIKKYQTQSPDKVTFEDEDVSNLHLFSSYPLLAYSVYRPVYRWNTEEFENFC